MDTLDEERFGNGETKREKVKFGIGVSDSNMASLDEFEPLMEMGSTPPSPASISRPMVIHELSSPKLLVELFEFHRPEGLEDDQSIEANWEETARWVRYEEDVEGADHRWGRPHVAFLAFHSLLQLRQCFGKGVTLLGVHSDSYADICAKIADALSKTMQTNDQIGRILLNALEKNFMHVEDKSAFFPRNLSKQRSVLSGMGSQSRSMEPNSPTSPQPRKEHSAHVPLGAAGRAESTVGALNKKRSIFRLNSELSTVDLLKRVPQASESAQVFVATIKELTKMRFCMVRLSKALNLPQILDAPIPIRFIFLITGPPLPDVDYHELGRAVATLMSNEHFHHVAYQAQTKMALLRGLDQFLDCSVVIPPGEIEKKSLLNADSINKALRQRLTKKDEANGVQHRKPIVLRTAKSAQDPPKKQYDPLRRTGRPFAGVFNDIKHRLPYYWSDIKDAFHLQCIPSLVFMFFAAFAPAITFGGLLGDKVDGWMGGSEVLVAQALCGVVWGIFSCQPVLIMAATGPVILFEGSLYEFCKSYGLEFMVVRVWASIWILVLALLTVMLEGSFLVRYVTRFTEDIFATLISLIFCYESLKFVAKNFVYHPVRTLDDYCTIASNKTDILFSNSTWNETDLSLIAENHTLLDSIDHKVSKAKYYDQPDTALLSLAFVVATFTMAFALRQIRTSFFFSRTIRKAIGDFGVPIAILMVVLIYKTCFTEPYVQKLKMPPTFSPTDASKRGWFIHPMGMSEPLPLWAIAASAIPALLVYILIFVEIEITELLLATKERGLRKGSGFHYDLVLAGILAVVCGLMGLPWMCAAAVQSLAHASSLTVMKRKAPGERPEVDVVLEQRVTTIGVALLTGACAFLGSLLQKVPMAALFGIFLYLGIISMLGVQFLQRVILIFVPQKYHPDAPYCKQVRLRKMNVYTLMQVVCLVILWIIKSIKITSLVFPFILMLVAVARQFLLPKIFDQKELNALDGHDDHDDHADESQDPDFYEQAHLPM